MLKGVYIDNIVFGGPAYNSEVLKKGDKILKVDGNEVTAENVTHAMVGCDLAGSLVSLEIKRPGAGNSQAVTLTRMATEAIADRRAMFELFTTAKNRANHHDDKTTAALIDKAIILWTKMLDEDAEHDRKIADNVISMQSQGSSIICELSKQLESMHTMFEAVTGGSLEVKGWDGPGGGADVRMQELERQLSDLRKDRDKFKRQNADLEDQLMHTKSELSALKSPSQSLAKNLHMNGVRFSSCMLR